MVDSSLVPAIGRAIQENELGTASAYCLSYACRGTSAASFGIFQGDTNVNHVARATLLQVLQAHNTDSAAITRIIAGVSQPCPNGSALNAADGALADAALASDQRRVLVDAMDTELLHIVLAEVDTCLSAASQRNLSIDRVVLLYIALWVNMTGAPETLNKCLSGTQEVGLVSPVGPVVTKQSIEAYLQANTYFRLHPHNFVHMQTSVNAGAGLLPPQ